MIEDENHPEWQAVELALAQQVATLFAERGFDLPTIEIAQELCDSATKKARERGLRFPDMVVCYFIHSRAVRIYDRDATHERKQSYIVRLTRDYPRMSAQEIADAFRRAWPDYRPHIEEKQSMLKGPIVFPESQES
jgi:hypothetical protein